MNVTVLDHPLINHYMTIIRNKNTSSSEFKSLAKKVSVLMAFEVFKELLVNNHKIETPIGNYRGIKINELVNFNTCLLYTSPSPRDMRRSRMPSSA